MKDSKDLDYNTFFRELLEDYSEKVPIKIWQQLVNLLRPDTYLVQRFVMQGGECVALLVRDELDREIFLKLLLPDEQLDSFGSDKNMKKRMMRGTALQSLFHKKCSVGIVPEVFDVSFFEDRSYVCMQWVDGKPLLDHLQATEDFDERIDVFLEVARAVEEIHSYGIVHGDIKDINIKISKGKAAILDWGHAKKMEGSVEITQEHIGMGSVLHMAPEQMGMAKYRSYQSDVYAAGVVLWQCCSQREPIQIETERGPEVYCDPAYMPISYQAIFTRARNKDLQERYQDIKEMIDAVESLLKKDRYKKSQRIEAKKIIQVVQGKADEKTEIYHEKKYSSHKLTNILTKFFLQASELKRNQ